MNYKAAVAAGIAFLDEKSKSDGWVCDEETCDACKPRRAVVPSDWRDRVLDRIDILNMSSTENCVLGILFGFYNPGLERLGLSDADAVNYGFTTDDSFPPLTREWREQLAQLHGEVIKVGDRFTGSGPYGVEIVDIVEVNNPDGGDKLTRYITRGFDLEDGKPVFPRGLDLGIDDRAGILGWTRMPQASFVPEKGMFVKNHSGESFYFDGELYWPTDGGPGTGEVNTQGLTEVTLTNGTKFRDLVND